MNSLKMFYIHEFYYYCTRETCEFIPFFHELFKLSSYVLSRIYFQMFLLFKELFPRQRNRERESERVLTR